MIPTITLLERNLAQAPPEYGSFHRRDAVTVLAESAANLTQHGGFTKAQLPDPLRLAMTFSEFYEAALGAFDTPSAFGQSIEALDATIADIARVAAAAGWEALEAQLEHTSDALAALPAPMLAAHLSSGPQSQADHDRLLALLVTDYEELVEADVAAGYPMRRAAAGWLLSLLKPAHCDDATALPPLPRTVEAARKRIGASHEIPTKFKWRASVDAWRRKWRPQ